MPQISVTPPAREIQSRMFDSARWNHVNLRPDDIVVATWAKSGTTLTQQMVGQLVSQGAREGVSAFAESPWVDVRFLMPLEALAPMLEAQSERRILKTHLPIDAVPMSSQMKYVYIGRDGRDVLWSAYNHATAFTAETLSNINGNPGPWPPWSPVTMDVRDYYLHWLKTDTTPGFHDLSFWDHVQGWWDARGQENILLLHYANLIEDLPGEMRRLAAFLDIEIDEGRFPAMIEHCGIDYMRSHVAVDHPLASRFTDGAARFFNKGTNGRWREVLSAEEIALCDEVAARRLTPDCAHWLRTGRMEGRW